MNELNEGIFENEYLSSEGEAEEIGGGYGTAYGMGRGRPFTEEQELELAMELLTVSSEQELEQFLGSLFKKVGQVAGKVIHSPVGQALGGLLKQAAKKALPIIGGAVGTYFGGPAGTQIGSQLGSAAGQMFGLELEGLSGEDRELEVAQRVVRLATDAAQQAAQAPAGASAQQVARTALAAAAARHAPGLLSNGAGKLGSFLSGQPGQHGRWIRRGNKIVVLGV